MTGMAGVITALDNLIVTPTLASIRKDLGGGLAQKRGALLPAWPFPLSYAAGRSRRLGSPVGHPGENGWPVARPVCRVLPAERFPAYCIMTVR